MKRAGHHPTAQRHEHFFSLFLALLMYSLLLSRITIDSPGMVEINNHDHGVLATLLDARHGGGSSCKSGRSL